MACHVSYQLMPGPSQVQHELLNVVAKAKASVSANLDSERHIFTSNDDYLKTLVSLKKDIMSENSTVKGTDKSSKAAGFTSSILAMDKWRSKAPEDFADDATRSCPARYIDGVSQTLLLQALRSMATCLHMSHVVKFKALMWCAAKS